MEDKSKILAKKPNPVLDQKNKTVAEIASELSLSKLNENNKNKKKLKKMKMENEKKKIIKLNILPFFIIALGLIFFLAIFFRSTLLSYSFFISQIIHNLILKKLTLYLQKLICLF